MKRIRLLASRRSLSLFASSIILIFGVTYSVKKMSAKETCQPMDKQTSYQRALMHNAVFFKSNIDALRYFSKNRRPFSFTTKGPSMRPKR